MVYLEVRDLDHTLRRATDQELLEHEKEVHAKRHVAVPKIDGATTELRPLDRMHLADVVRYGTKASNLGEIAAAHLGVPIPDGFGVPFAFYVDHLRRNHIDKEIDKLLRNPRFAGDPDWRKNAVEELRARIAKAPINPKNLDRVWAKIQKDLGGKGVFVRSSTNAEDLEGFNGAGLYDTVPNVTSKEQLADALRQVWASLWNFHAVEERTLYNMDQRACAVAILVQIGVNATAAGVLITKNLFDPEDVRSYTINAKRGLGLRVVGGTTIPEQIVYDTGNFGTKIISRSDDPTMLVFDGQGGVKEVPNDNKGVILTEARARLLSDTVTRFVPLFTRRFPLDVEWVLEGEKVWIVQSRPYVD
jgi:phosphoenolpyruvate synthase/pyruvate phosphate dikinase